MPSIDSSGQPICQSAIQADQDPGLTRGTDQQMGGDRTQNQGQDDTRLHERTRASDAAVDRMHSDVHNDRLTSKQPTETSKDGANARLIEQGTLHDFQLSDEHGLLKDERGLQKDSRFRGLSVSDPESQSSPTDKAPGPDNEKVGDNKSAEAPFTEVSRSPNFDQKKPTVAFLDGFNEDANKGIGDFTYVPHGDISMSPAQKIGYNTIGLQINEKEEMNKTNDFSKQLNGIADQIKSKQLPLGNGDAVNVSMGNADPTFQQASQFLGFDVNAQNLASQKDHILSRMDQIANDPSRSAEDRFTAGEVVRTNQAIDRIQNEGVEVVHAGGNNGPDKFSWDFLEAKSELSSVKPSGAPDNFAASNSTTKPADGILPITHDANLRPLDPTPAAKQGGSFTVGGVSFPADREDLFSGNSKIFNRETINPDGLQPMQTPNKPPLSAGDFSPNRIYKNGEPLRPNLGDSTAPASDRFSGQAAPAGTRVMKMQPYGTDSPYPHRELQPGESLSSSALAGTSFSNIDYYRKNFERLQKLKNGQ
jgi:hypothetical protein